MTGSARAPVTEIPVAAVSPERFRELLGDRFAELEEATRTAGELFAGRVIWHVNSTARGGGVAEMLQSLIAYARGAGVDVRWVTIAGNERVLRGHQATPQQPPRLPPATAAGSAMPRRAIYEEALAASAEALAERIRPTTSSISTTRSPPGSPGWPGSAGRDGDLALPRRRRSPERARAAGLGLSALPTSRRRDAYVFSRREFVWDGLDTKAGLDRSPIDRRLLSEEPGSRRRASSIRSSPRSGWLPMAAPGHRSSGARMAARGGSIGDAELKQDGPLPATFRSSPRSRAGTGSRTRPACLRCFAEHLPAPQRAPGARRAVGRGGRRRSGGRRGARRGASAIRASLPDEVRARVHLASPADGRHRGERGDGQRDPAPRRRGRSRRASPRASA